MLGCIDMGVLKTLTFGSFISMATLLVWIKQCHVNSNTLLKRKHQNMHIDEGFHGMEYNGHHCQHLCMRYNLSYMYSMIAQPPAKGAKPRRWRSL